MLLLISWADEVGLSVTSLKCDRLGTLCPHAPVHEGRFWQGRFNQYCTKPINTSPPSALLYTNTPGVLRSPDTAITYLPLDSSRLRIWPMSHVDDSALMCL